MNFLGCQSWGDMEQGGRKEVFSVPISCDDLHKRDLGLEAYQPDPMLVRWC